MHDRLNPVLVNSIIIEPDVHEHVIFGIAYAEDIPIVDASINETIFIFSLLRNHRLTNFHVNSFFGYMVTIENKNVNKIFQNSCCH